MNTNLASSPSSIEMILEVMAMIGLILWRQLATRRVRDNLVVMPLILGVLGLVMTVQAAAQVQVTAGMLVTLALALGVSVALGRPRARSLRIWRAADGTLLRSGTWATLGWWLAVFVVRGAVDVVLPRLFDGGASSSLAVGFASSTMLLCFAVSLASQNWCLARRLRAEGHRVGAPASVPAYK